jgi:hypothetical protein
VSSDWSTVVRSKLDREGEMALAISWRRQPSIVSNSDSVRRGGGRSSQPYRAGQ